MPGVQQADDRTLQPAEDPARCEKEDQPQVADERDLLDEGQADLVGWVQCLAGGSIGPKVGAGGHGNSRRIEQDIEDQAGDHTADGA